MSSFFSFVYNQIAVTQPYPTSDFSGKTIVVTGSNVGLGLEAARHFTRLNAEKLILAVRSLEKGNEAKQSIEESTHRTGVVEVWELDLSSYQSVEKFAAKAQTLERLDVLVENAGINAATWSIAEGQERTITVNVISTFLLALLMLPKLYESASKFKTLPHLVIVSSEVHFWTSLPQRKEPSILAALADKSKADMADRYNVSKLLELFYVRALALHMKESKNPEIVVNAVTPGLCHSELGRDQGAFFGVIKFVLARTTEMGSRSLVHAAQGGEETNGQFLYNCRVSSPSPFVLSEEGAKTQSRVFDEISDTLESIHPEILKNI